ncbi:MAG: DNA polymerase Y family protein, partial [Alphaproteobacteria bacterium]|nr:DNA polymerase Y family protein [Alphaproteobacteria bacterium]
MTYLSPIAETPANRAETRIAALHFPWFESERLMRQEPILRRTPFALIEEARGRLALTAVNPRASACGLKPGMALADARAVLPELSTRFARPEEDRRALSRL